MPRALPLAPSLLVAALAATVFACDDGQAPDTDPRTLTVAVDGNGRGAITSDPAGIDCSHEGGTCTADFDLGAEITLTVTPGLRTVFAGWAGPCAGAGTGDCTFNLNEDATVTVALDNPQLVEAVIGAGGGSITSVDSALTLTFPAGALGGDTTITLEQVTADDLGSEWNDIVAAGDVAPYEMGPSGLTFAEPVTATFRSSQIPETTDSSTTITPELLLTGGDSVEVLGNMTTTVDAEGNVVATAEIEHFSLVVMTSMGAFKWRLGLFASSPHFPGDNLWAHQMLSVDGDLLVGDFSGAEYQTSVQGVYDLVSEPSGPFEETNPNHAQANHDFTCQEAGEGDFFFRVLVTVGGTIHVLERTVTHSCDAYEPQVKAEVVGTGNGEIAMDPGDHTCNTLNACYVRYPTGTEVTLTATPIDPSTFSGWAPADSVCSNTQEATITFTVGTENIHCKAAFVDADEAGLNLVAEVLLQQGDATPSNSHGTTVVEGADEIDTAAEAGSSSAYATDAGTATAGSSTTTTARHVASVDAVSGDFFLWRWTDPAAPELIYSEPGLCPGAHQVIYDPTGKYSSVPYFDILSLPEQTSCYVEVDTDGFYWGSTYNFKSYGEKALVPNSEIEALALFQDGQLSLFDPSTSDSRLVSLSGSERSCPYSVETTADRVFVVGREGEAGTSNENCNNWRKLFVVDITGFPGSAPLEGSVDVGDMPRDVAINAAGTTAYVADFANDEIHVIDAETVTITRTIPVGDGPTGLALTPDDAHLLVANWNAGTVQVIDLATDEVIIDHTTGYTQPVKIDLTGDGTGVIVTHWGGDNEDASVVYYELYIP